MVPARPGAPLKVVESQFFLQLLIVLLHPPAPPGGGDQPLEAHAFRQITQVVFDRLCLVDRPLHQ